MLYTLELDHSSVAPADLNSHYSADFKVKQMVKTEGLEKLVNEFFKQKQIDCNRYSYPVPPDRSGVVMQVIPDGAEVKDGVIRLTVNLSAPKKGVAKMFWQTNKKFILVLTPIFEQPHKLIGFSELTLLADAAQFI